MELCILVKECLTTSRTAFLESVYMCGLAACMIVSSSSGPRCFLLLGQIPRNGDFKRQKRAFWNVAADFGFLDVITNMLPVCPFGVSNRVKWQCSQILAPRQRLDNQLLAPNSRVLEGGEGADMSYDQISRKEYGSPRCGDAWKLDIALHTTFLVEPWHRAWPFFRALDYLTQLSTIQ